MTKEGFEKKGHLYVPVEKSLILSGSSKRGSQKVEGPFSITSGGIIIPGRIKETAYGVISDVHKDPHVVRSAIEVLRSLGAEKLLVNGDIGERLETLEKSQQYIAVILDAIGRSGLESYVQPGSHEFLAAFKPVLDYFKDKFPNLIDALETPKIENGDHHLVFLPGSDLVSGGEYIITADKDLDSGLYIRTKEGLIPYSEEAQQRAMEENDFAGHFHFSNIDDLRKLVTKPDKTIIVCHVPRRFEDNIDQAIDMAYFGESRDGRIIPGEYVEEKLKEMVGNYISGELVRHFAITNGIIMKIENRGNEELRDLYKELGITKAVSGHFHESGHRAHDENVNPLPEGEFVRELYWNSGQLDKGQTGILRVRDGKVSYQNIKLEDYLQN